MASHLTAILESPGWELLQTLEKDPRRRQMDPLALGQALRDAGIPGELAAALLGQLALRDHAESKFGEFARSMVFTRDGLEQATRMIVAALHAQRFKNGGTTYVADLGCGIGSDSLAIAGLGLRVLAIDIDKDAAAAAAANLRALPDAQVELGDVMDLTMSELRQRGIDAIFADPARRSTATRGSKRLMDPEQWSPPLSHVLSWRSDIESIGVKLAPGIDHQLLPTDCHAQWISIDGELVEAAVWTPPLSPEGPGRSALVIRNGQAHLLADSIIDAANAPNPQAVTGPIGRYVSEPDNAVIRSGGVAHLAELLGAHLLTENIAYMTGDSIPDSPFIQRFEVLDVVPLRSKAISAALRSHDIGVVEIKKRGADIDPAQLRSSLKLNGPEHGVVILTRIAGRHRAIIAKR